jgi:cellulose synthase/poly-beta-1,6-N-acetylglucosamine synthase-like glycosyltransferase
LSRNEAFSIPYLLRDLAKQRYPKTLLEVIIINDHSTDDSVFQIENLRNELGFPVHIIHLEEFDVRGKKNAIKIGVQKAQGELIVCTDADCRVGEFWILGMQQLYKGQNAKLISGGVTFIPNGRLWTVLQSIEFASLVGSGACAMMIGKPNMCNGANIAYPKAVFEEVNGFDGNEHIASGDDEFLMHKIAEKYPNQIVFAHYQPNIVFTQSQENLRTFVQQRKRWPANGIIIKIGKLLFWQLLFLPLILVCF